LVDERDAEGVVKEASEEMAGDLDNQASNDPSEGEPEQRPELEENMQVDLTGANTSSVRR
jgi:hypothetical protein